MANARTVASKRLSRKTTMSSGTTPTAVARAVIAGTSTPKETKFERPFTSAQLRAMQPFFKLAAEVDCVFDEDDAMDPAKRQIGMGRLYRAWKAWRVELDPDYNAHRDSRGA